MSARPRRIARLALLALVALSALTACTVSLPGGLIGGGVTLVLALLFLLFTGVSQTGCIDDKEPEPDPETDATVSPCLSDAAIGPCLGAPLDDAMVGPCLTRDAYVGPCLSPPLEDAAVGPCLSQLPADAGPDAHVGPCLGPPLPEDAAVGPCLDIAPDARVPDAAGPDAGAQRLPGREQILDRVLARGGLPADVVARLQKRRGGDA